MRIHVLFTRTFNLDGRIWHLSEKVPWKYGAPHSPDFECALKLIRRVPALKWKKVGFLFIGKFST